MDTFILVIVFVCVCVSLSIGGGALYYFSTKKKPSPSPSGKTPSPSPAGTTPSPSGTTPSPSGITPSPSPSGKTPSPSPSGKTPSPSPSPSRVAPPRKKAKYILLKRVDGKDTAINVLEIKVITPTKTLTKTDMTAVLDPQYASANEFGPEFLIDGSLNYTANGTTYTLPHTTDSRLAYMKLTLNNEEEIQQVSVHNRVDCCKDRIIGTQLQILASDNSIIFQAGLNDASDVFTWNDSLIYA